MPEDENNSQKKPKVEIPFTEKEYKEYLESLKGLRESMAIRSPGFISERLKKALEGFQDSSDARQSNLHKALESIQSQHAPLRLRAEISQLEEKARIQADELSKHSADKKNAAKEINKLRGIIDELNSKQGIQHLLNSVSEQAHEKIESDEVFRTQFASDSEVDAFVVSVDIRRSTELMLKARSPKLFADFITTLCGDLEAIFKENWAVVDKFTGDGILAFFPEFFSGEDAGYFALKASKLANEAFARRYREYRTSFTTVLNDVGLGIGIDYGKVHLVRMAGALTIVGQPVVYACRMGGAPAGHTLLNQPAFEVILERYENLTSMKEALITIKAEGELVAYDVALSNKAYSAALPPWKKEG